MQRVRMRLFQREMPEYEADLVGKSLQQEFRRGRRDFAARALEIAVLDQRDPRMLGTQIVIGGLGRNRQA